MAITAGTVATARTQLTVVRADACMRARGYPRPRGAKRQSMRSQSQFQPQPLMARIVLTVFAGVAAGGQPGVDHFLAQAGGVAARARHGRSRPSRGGTGRGR